MRNPLSETIVNIKPSGIRKFFDLVSEMNDKDVISLGVGEPDFDTPWHVRDEGIYSLEKGRTFYTSNSGLKELREEICNYPEVDCVYLISGGFDFMVMIEGKTMRGVAQFVSEKLSTQESVLSTATHFILKKYKDHGSVMVNPSKDERMLVTP